MCGSFPYGYTVKSTGPDSTQEASDRTISELSKCRVRTPHWDWKPVWTLTASDGNCLSTSTVPKFMPQQTEKYPPPALSFLSFFSLTHPASRHLQLTFQTSDYESKLTAGGLAGFLSNLEKSDSE